MKDEEFMNQKVSEMTIEEMIKAIKIKQKQQSKIDDAEDVPLRVLFKDETLEIIARLQKNSGVKNRGDVVVDALALYDKIDKITESGKFVIRDDHNKWPEHILEIPRKK